MVFMSLGITSKALGETLPTTFTIIGMCLYSFTIWIKAFRKELWSRSLKYQAIYYLFSTSQGIRACLYDRPWDPSARLAMLRPKCRCLWVHVETNISLCGIQFSSVYLTIEWYSKQILFNLENLVSKSCSIWDIITPWPQVCYLMYQFISWNNFLGFHNDAPPNVPHIHS